MHREKSCGAVVFIREDGKILYLLLKYFGDYYDFPKGNQEAGETEIDTVKREVAEETDITDLKIIEGFNEQVKYFYQRENQIVHKEVSYYLAETGTKEVRISYEHKGHMWADYDVALKSMKFQNSRKIIEKARNFISTIEKDN